MTVKLSVIAASVFLLSLFSACGSQQANSPSSSGAQIASTSSSGQKCEVDAKRVCQEMKDRPVVDSETGQTHDRTEREQNAARTDTRISSLQIPGGSMIEVQCEINTMHNSVVYAHLMPSPRLTATDVAYLQNSGYCAH
jgi:hypothetical protein